jgi:tetratricopeptide (TPR) repeat protein
LTPSPYIIAFAAAALFAVHPLATGSIAYISGRTGPLLAVNYFLALNLFVIGYLSEVINFALIAYMLFFTFNVVALFCNVQAVTLPLSAVLIGLLLKDPKQAWKEWRDSRGYELIFFFLAAIGEPFLLLLGVPKLTDNGLGLHVLPAASYVASQFKLLVTYYLRCFLIPYGLTTDPANVVASGLSDPLALLGLAVMAGAAAAAWIWRQQTFLVLGLALFLLGLFPANLLVQAELVADQRFYLSLAGLCLAGGWGLAEFYTRNKRAAGAVGLILLLGWGALTVLRNRQWATDELLWQQAIKLNPDSARAHALYAKSLKKPEDAYKEAKRALELDPKNVIALQSVADYDLSREKYAETEDALQTAISISLRENVSAVDLANLQERLAKCYVKENKLDKADALAKEVLRVLPEDTGMNIVVAQALIARKNYILAFTTLAPNLTENPALGKDPDYMRALAEAGLNSGVARWMEQGLLAALQYTKLSPGRDSRIFLTKCLLGMNEPLQALEAIEPIVKLANDKDAEADYLKALALEGIKHSEQAQEEKELALKLDPKIAEKVVIKKLKSPAKSAPDGKSRMQPGMAPPSPGVIPELRPAQQPAATAKPADTKSSTTTSTSTGH